MPVTTDHKPSPEQIARLIAASPDISEAAIEQANEQLDYLAAMARQWIRNGDDRHGPMLQCLTIAFEYQQLAIDKLSQENANLRAKVRHYEAPAVDEQVQAIVRGVLDRAFEDRWWPSSQTDAVMAAIGPYLRRDEAVCRDVS